MRILVHELSYGNEIDLKTVISFPCGKSRTKTRFETKVTAARKSVADLPTPLFWVQKDVTEGRKASRASKSTPPPPPPPLH